MVIIMSSVYISFVLVVGVLVVVSPMCDQDLLEDIYEIGLVVLSPSLDHL